MVGLSKSHCDRGDPGEGEEEDSRRGLFAEPRGCGRLDVNHRGVGTSRPPKQGGRGTKGGNKAKIHKCERRDSSQGGGSLWLLEMVLLADTAG